MNKNLPEVLTAINADIPQFIENVKTLEIKSFDSMDGANNFLFEIKRRTKRIKEYKEKFAKPLRDKAREISKQFDVYDKPLKELEGIIKDKMKVFYVAEEKKKEKQLEEVKKNEILPIVEAPKQNVKTEKATTSFKKVWAFKIKNIEHVPTEFLCVDEKKVNEAIKEGRREITGVEIYQETVVSTRI